MRALICIQASAALILAAGCGPSGGATPATVGRLTHAGATEASGLAPSSRSTALLWTHGDSGGQPVLYAVGKDGRLRGSLRIEGVRNIDWEDVSSFRLDGRSWLLVADTGDNNGRRKSCTLLVVPEPDPTTLSPGREVTTPVEWSIPIVYPDGPHDCEAVSVDVREQQVYLITKRTSQPLLFVVPLARDAQASATKAKFIGPLAGIPQPTAQQKVLPVPTGRYRAQVTGLAFSPDGRAAAVLTYADVLLYRRSVNDEWADAFARAPEILPPHNLPQAEALCFSSDSRSLFVTGEEKTPALLRYRLPSPEPH